MKPGVVLESTIDNTVYQIWKASLRIENSVDIHCKPPGKDIVNSIIHNYNYSADISTNVSMNTSAPFSLRLAGTNESIIIIPLRLTLDPILYYLTISSYLMILLNNSELNTQV